MKLNHNLLGWLIPLMVAVLLTGFIHFVPAIGLAPAETSLKVLLRLAIFMGAWTTALRFLGGTQFSVTEYAKQLGYGIIYIACAVIIGIAIVIAK